MRSISIVFVMFLSFGASAKLYFNEPDNYGPLVAVTKVSITVDTRESERQRVQINIWTGEQGGCSISKSLAEKVGFSLVELYSLLKSISEDQNSRGVLYCEKKKGTLLKMDAVEFLLTND